MKKELHQSAFTHQPHDKLTKRLLSKPYTARDILNLYLPAEIMAMTDLDTLELQRDSFIDDEHRAHAVDQLYKTRFHGQEGYIWILLEHQRQSDYWMPVRLFKYIAIIWDHIRRTSESTGIPLIYPMVIYNGDYPYRHSLNLSDLIQPEAGKEIFLALFSKPFHLVDLTTIEDDALREASREKVYGASLLMALKHVMDKDLQEYFDHTLVKVLRQLDELGDKDVVVDIIYYLLNEGEFVDKERFWITLHDNFSKEVENKMTTIAQDLIEKGMEQGLMQTAKRLFHENKTLGQGELIAWVHRITGLPIEKLKALVTTQN